MEKQPSINELIHRGSLGLLATGYRGILAWKANRKTPAEKPSKDKERNGEKA